MMQVNIYKLISTTTATDKAIKCSWKFVYLEIGWESKNCVVLYTLHINLFFLLSSSYLCKADSLTCHLHEPAID